jgi:hypothetical protein
MRLLELYPDADWDWEELCENINVPIEFLVENLHREDVRKNISCNPNITLAFVKANPQIPWNWEYLSHYMNMTWEDFLNNRNLPWNVSYVIVNVGATFDMIMAIRGTCVLDWGIISESKGIKWEDFEQNQHLKWNMHVLAHHPNFSVEDIWNHVIVVDDTSSDDTSSEGEYIDDTLSLADISDYHVGDIKLKEDEEYEFKKQTFEIYSVSINPSLTSDFVKDNYCDKWNWDKLGRHINFSIDEAVYWSDRTDLKISIWWNPNITLKRAVELGDKYIEFTMLFSNAAIDIKELKDYPDLEIDHYSLSSNATLNWKYVHENPNVPWAFHEISANKFNYHPYFGSEPHMRKMRKHFMENFAEAIAKRKID